MIPDARRNHARPEPWSHRPRIACDFLGTWQCVCVTELRVLRLEMERTQVQLAEALSVPVNTLRMWDSGLRKAPDWIMGAARALAAEQHHQCELLPLHALAAELGIHKSTLEGAIRSGRLRAQFSTRSVFGRPIRCVARIDGERFRKTAYGRRNAPVVCSAIARSATTNAAAVIPAPNPLATMLIACLSQMTPVELAVRKRKPFQYEKERRIGSSERAR